MQFRRRMTALAMAGGVTAGLLTAVAASPAQAAPGCSVTYTVSNSWPGGFQGSIRVANTGDAWSSWSLRFSFGGGATATQGWGGVWTTGGSPTVTNAAWNGSVGTGGAIELGFIGGGNGSGSTPSSFSVNGTTCGGGTTPPTTAPPTTRPPTTAPPTTRPPTTAPPTTRPPTTQPPTGSCNVAPVDPQASRQARNLLCYLYSIYGRNILSGQQESVWVDGPDYEMNIVNRATGEYPAIRGLDYGDSQSIGARAVSWWNAGGIPMVGYHMGAPNQDSDGYSGSRLRGNISAALTAGTADNRRLNQRLDGVASALQQAEDAGAPVIFRPYHEASGTWFWWSMEGPALYNRLWAYTYNYMTNTKGLHNLVWMHPFNGSPSSAWYPGKQYVDIGGADTYANNYGPLTSMYNAARGVYGSTIPIALHENGRIPDPAQLQSAGSRWVLFNTWHTSFISDQSINPTSHLRAVYNHPYVINRDEVPNLR